MIIRSRAPVRVDFSGGWTDVALFTEESKGFVVNAAIDIYSYVTVKKLQDKEILTNSYGYNHKETVQNRAVKIYSADFDIYEEAEEIKQLEYNGNIDLAKAAVKRMDIQGGLEIITRSNAPAGSGLGTSASMGVALIGALSLFEGVSFLPYEFAEQASLIEQRELGILGGKQDHYASAIGGISFMEFMGEDVKASRLQLSQDVLYELEKSLVLCYTGRSRLSSDIHRKVREAYVGSPTTRKEKESDVGSPTTRKEGESAVRRDSQSTNFVSGNTLDEGKPGTRQALRNLRAIAFEMKNCLLREDLRTFGQLLNENWENQKVLHPSVTNSQIDEIFDVVMANGAIGGKACGAGGGGCLLFYAQPDCEHLVRRELENVGVSVMDFSFDFTGVRMWTA